MQSLQSFENVRPGVLAILGATSRLAIDFVLTAADYGHRFVLYGRRPDALSHLLAEHGLPSDWRGGTLSDFHQSWHADPEPLAGVLNFVGVGDPARAHAMGAEIFEATATSDQLALRVVQGTTIPYVFLSSGAVYGTRFAEPVQADTPSVIPVNALAPQDVYGVAKLHAEAIHRASTATIIDVRIFNYFSRRVDPNARFLITDLLHALREGKVFETRDEDMTRDYLHPHDLTELLLACLSVPPGTNRPVDAYSRAPIGKRELLALMSAEFGLRYRLTDDGRGVNATGAKPHYFSQNRAAAELGYLPRYSSADTILSEAGILLAGSSVAASSGARH
jgi:nucleoside-diphosphate-sugar epimerase